MEASKVVTREAPSIPRTIVDGLALAVLLVLIVTAERFDGARTVLESLLAEEAKAAEPGWLVEAWVMVTVLGCLVGGFVAWRFVDIARAIGGGRRIKLVRVLAFVAVVLWTAWQTVSVFALDHGSGPSFIGVLHWVVVAAAAITVGVGGAVTGDATKAWERAPVVRIQLVFLAGLFFIVFAAPFTADQMTDVLRAWGDEDELVRDRGNVALSRPLAGIAAALLLGGVCRASASRLLVPNASALIERLPRRLSAPIRKVPPSMRGRQTVQRALFVALALLGSLILLAVRVEGAAFLALSVAVIAAVTEPVPRAALERRGGDNSEEQRRVSLRRLAGTLGVVPLAILLIGLVGASVDSLLLPSGASPSDVGLFVWTAVVVVVTGLLAARAHSAGGLQATNVEDRLPAEVFGVLGFAFGSGFLLSGEVAACLLLLCVAVPLGFRALGERGAPELWGASGVVLGVGVAVYVEPIETSRAIGAFGLALFGAAGVLATLHLAGSVGVRRRVRWQVLGRTWAAPVVLVLGLSLAGAYVTVPERAHQARTVATEASPVGLDRAVKAWLTERARPAPGEKHAPKYIPMLLVGASGGGSKAAYWTALVLDCVFGEHGPSQKTDECSGAAEVARRRFDSLFLTSSVSGGSVGIYHLLTHRGQSEPWINATAGREVLSPLIGWGMFHDLPAFVLGLPTDPSKCTNRLGCPLNADRALVQEAAVGMLADGTPADPDKGLLEQHDPITIFNGAEGWGPGRVLISPAPVALPEGCPLDGAEPIAGAIDGHDVLAGQDVPLVTAAVLSARFPGLAPAARLGETEPATRECDGDATQPPVGLLRDGGIVENTGLLTIVQLLPAIQRSVAEWQRLKPERSRIDVQPIVLSIDDDVLRVAGDGEYASGLAARLGFGGSKDRSVRVRNVLKRCERFTGVRYERISPAPRVGAQAATGWEMSETARQEDLGDTLRSAAGRARIHELRRMLDGPPVPRCVARP